VLLLFMRVTKDVIGQRTVTLLVSAQCTMQHVLRDVGPVAYCLAATARWLLFLWCQQHFLQIYSGLFVQADVLAWLHASTCCALVAPTVELNTLQHTRRCTVAVGSVWFRVLSCQAASANCSQQ
jgi:hypothetical protein